MKFREDHLTEKTTHENFRDFYEKQIVIDLDVGETVSIAVDGIEQLAYTMRFEKGHFNFSLQDKSNTMLTEAEKLQAQIDNLQVKLTEELAKGE